jgi:hypothetical protein
MRHQDLPRTLPGLVQHAPFPVYGSSRLPADFRLCSYGAGISHLGHLFHVVLSFASPRYSLSHPTSRCSRLNEALCLDSIDASVESPGREGIARHLADLQGDELVREKLEALAYARADKATIRVIPSPQERSVDLMIDKVPFRGILRSWGEPAQVTVFLLRSSRTVLEGHASGLAVEELLQILESLEVVNQSKELLRRYQQQFESQYC